MPDSKATQWLLNAATVVVTVAAVALTFVRVSEYFSGRTSVELQPTKVRDWREYSATGIRLGAEQAKVVVVEFSDFFCPFCRKAAPDLREVRKTFPNDVQFVYRHLPLDDGGFSAAVATECAARMDRFERYHDILFELLDSLGQVSLPQVALRAGISDTARFARCLQDSSAVAAVRRDIAAARRLGVTGTPTILINELRFPANPGAERMIAIVRERLK